MSLHRWGIAGLLAGAGVAFWLLLAGPSRLLGVDAGQAGTALLVTVAWVSMYRVSRLPGDELGAAASPAEWKAWIGAGFMLAAIVYFLAKIEVFAAAGVFADADASAVARNLVLLLVAWSVLSTVLASRWKGAVEEDERDRAIAARAAAWGRGALVVAVIMLAVALGLSPASRLQWASHFMVANLLVLAVMWGCLFEYAAGAVLHWRARR
ncbi:hypothetical protein MQC88_08570 [Luteimonas sp. 50]|uniref:DUF3180 domain-containing protein n=1 Tax=Cognatiluteimonas sedimenti TaxID=2927791 RepID=A0ABT0A4U2_9GAMM|nr:hypothetical protein [Lysobacter sedimenti]MCJ0826008.1 hypothetical protein [Lysobacter sedimenti]